MQEFKMTKRIENYWKIVNVLKAFQFRMGAVLWDAQKQCSCFVGSATDPKFSTVTYTGPAIAPSGALSVCFSTVGTGFYQFHQGYVKTWRYQLAKGSY